MDHFIRESDSRKRIGKRLEMKTGITEGGNSAGEFTSRWDPAVERLPAPAVGHSGYLDWSLGG